MTHLTINTAPENTLSNETLAVKISNLRKSFDGRLVLGGIDLDVPKGRIVSIIGQSGGGKTTLMRCVNLLERPEDGVIEIGGETIFAKGAVTCRDLAKLRQRVGMVFQRFNLFPHLTAVENVVLAQMHAAATGEREAVERAVWLLTRVGLAGRAMAYPERMSGGEQQRARLAHRHGPDARHDLALWQMPVPDDAPAAVVGLQIGGLGTETRTLPLRPPGSKAPAPHRAEPRSAGRSKSLAESV